METVKTNRQYKSSVFTALFGEKENLLELYNAIENTNYGKDTDIVITTLEDALFMEQLNDISFVINGKIVVLMEHQSTINKNMPMRGLVYVSRVYERLFGKKNLYREKAIPIPKPEIIVLYNGKDYMPDQQELKLSDMFIDLGVGEAPNLECIVKVFNINKGCNEELAKRSEALKGYENFIYLIREYAKSMERSSAIVKAIDDCIRQNVLKEFLERNASEVRNMLFGWDWDEAKEVWQEEAREDGEAIGVAKGIAIGRDEGVAIGEARGIALGELRGKEEGLQQAARQMKAKGFNTAVICEITGLSEAEILSYPSPQPRSLGC